jgi:O-antigen/teichoic acid export membrane protein
MSGGGRLVKNTLRYMPAQLLGPFVQFATVILWTHLLDPATFGVVAFVIAAQELTAYFGIFWWSMYVARFRRRHAAQDYERFRAMDARVALVGSASQALSAPFILAAVAVDQSAILVAATALYLVTRLLLFHYSEWARSDHRFEVYTVAQLHGPIAGSVLSVLCILAFGATPAVTLAALAVGQLFGLAAVLRGLDRRIGWGAFDAGIFADARRYGLPLVFSGFATWASINGIRVLVEWSEGIVGVGLLSAGWGLGQRLANVIAMLCTAAAFPLAVERLEAGDRRGAASQISNNSALMCGLLAPATAGVALLSAPVVNLLIAEQYRAVTLFVLPIAFAAGAMRSLKLHTSDQAALLFERTEATMVFNFVDAVITTIATAVGLYFGGVVGAALGCMVGTVIGGGLAIGYVIVKLGVPFPAAHLAKIAVATVLMTAALRALPPADTLLSLSAHIAVGASVYGLVVVALFAEMRGFVQRRLLRFREG